MPDLGPFSVATAEHLGTYNSERRGNCLYSSSSGGWKLWRRGQSLCPAESWLCYPMLGGGREEGIEEMERQAGRWEDLSGMGKGTYSFTWYPLPKYRQLLSLFIITIIHTQGQSTHDLLIFFVLPWELSFWHLNFGAMHSNYSKTMSR